MPKINEQGHYVFEKHERELITQMIDRDARIAATRDNKFEQSFYEALLPTAEEFELFIYRASVRRLDPLLDEIMFQKRQGKATALVRIDGFRICAERSKNYAPGRAYECFNEHGLPYYGSIPHMVVTYAFKRTDDGEWHEFSERAFFPEYAQYTRGGELTQMWKKMGRSQLAKCCEARMIRRGWPQDTQGLYTPEEMEQQTNGAIDAPAGDSRVEKDVAALKPGSANRGHGNEGLEKTKKSKKTAVAESPVVASNEGAKPEERPQTIPEVRKAIDKANPPKPPLYVVGQVENYSETKRNGEPLKTSRGTPYVSLTLTNGQVCTESGMFVNNVAPAKQKIDDIEREGFTTLICYHAHLFPALKITAGEECSFKILRDYPKDKARVYQNIEDVLRIGEMPFQDGKPLPGGLTERDTIPSEPPKQQKLKPPTAETLFGRQF